MLRLARSPIVHFLAIGVALFVLTRAFSDTRDPASYRIVIGQGQVDAAVATFLRTWRRPPTPLELRGLLEEQVRQEIYVREAMALGLDRDEMVRRRLRQKIEFVAVDRDDLYERLRKRYEIELPPPSLR